MNLLNIPREIGFFEAAANLAAFGDSREVCSKAAMPMPGGDFPLRTEAACDFLLRFGKRKFLFLSPEIALVDGLARKAGDVCEAFFAVPCDMEAEARERLRANLPKGMTVRLLDEPYFPEGFTPANGILVASGYLGGGRLLALPETYRMAEHYSSFWGKKVFLPYTIRADVARCPGWAELVSVRFDAIWSE